MIELLAFLETYFLLQSDIVGLVGDKAYAFVVPQEDEKEFVVYNLSENPKISKDAVCNYNLRITIGAERVLRLIEVKEVVKRVIENNPINGDYQGSTEIEQPSDLYYQMDLNFELIINLK